MKFCRSVSVVAVVSVVVALFCAPASAQELSATSAAASDLPFKRSVGVEGLVSGSLEESTLVAGVPTAAVAELIGSLSEGIDLDRDVHDGARFYVRYERTFSLAGTPLGGGRVLWCELHLSAKKGTVALHRYQLLGTAHDALWLANGQGAVPPVLRLPLKSYVMSSSFGLRVDPLDQPLGTGSGTGQSRGKGPARAPVLPSGLGSAFNGGVMPAVNVATPLGLSMGLVSGPATKGPIGGGGGVMAMHEGIDLVAPYGTPIHAAGDGIVKGAETKGRYGNWIQIDHPGQLASVYGHLSSFAPGIEPGKQITQGEVIGYIGLTGRTTGPHVHFEVRFKSQPVNPLAFSALKRPQLRGVDLDRLRKVVARNLREREGENRAAAAGL